MRVIYTVVPIAMLLAIGFLITLRSGVEGPSSREPSRRVLASNVSGLILRLFGLLAGILILNVVIGYPMTVNWPR